jgi:hypothetical protein
MRGRGEHGRVRARALWPSGCCCCCCCGGAAGTPAVARCRRAIHSYLECTFSARSTMLRRGWGRVLLRGLGGGSGFRGHPQLKGVEVTGHGPRRLVHARSQAHPACSNPRPARALPRPRPAPRCAPPPHLLWSLTQGRRGSVERMRSSRLALSPRCISTIALPIWGRTLPASSRSSTTQPVRSMRARRPLGLGTSSGAARGEGRGAWASVGGGRSVAAQRPLPPRSVRDRPCEPLLRRAVPWVARRGRSRAGTLCARARSLLK